MADKAELNEKETIPSPAGSDDIERKGSGPTTLEELRKSTTVDTIHNDEAVKVLAAYAGDEHWTPEEEKKVVRKIDRKLLFLLILTYGLQYYDKAMLSQAVRHSPSPYHRPLLPNLKLYAVQSTDICESS